MEQRHGDWHTVDTRQTLNIDNMPWCRKSWCLRNPGVTARKVLNQDWDPGSWTSESGNAPLELCWQMQSSTQWWWTWALWETVCSWVHMPTAQLFVQPCCSGVTPLETLERLQPRRLEMERVTIWCKLTLSRKVRERAKVKTNTREEIARPARPTRALQTSTRPRTVANLDIGRKIAGFPVEERVTLPLTEILAKARVNTQEKGKAKRWTLSKQNNFCFLKQPQPCRIFRKTRVLLENSRAFQAWNWGSWVWQSIPCHPYGDKRMPFICFLTVAHSFTPVQSRIQDKRYRCLVLKSTQQVEHDSNMTEDDWWHTNVQKDEEFECFSTCVQFRNPFSPLTVSLSRSTGVIFVEKLEHCSFLTRSRRNVATHSCTGEKVCPLSKGWWLRPCRQLEWVTKLLKSYRCQWVRRCWKTLRSRCLLVMQRSKILALPIRSWIEQHNLTHFPSQPWCKMCVESRGHDSPHRAQSKTDAVVPQLQFDYRYMGVDGVLPCGSRHLFWTNPRDAGVQIKRRWTCLTWLPEQPRGCVT